MRENLDDNLKVHQGNKAQSLAGSTSALGDKVDRRAHEETLLILNAGLCSGAVLSVMLQQTGLSTNGTDEAGGSWATVGSANFATITAANDNDIYVGRVKGDGLKQFLRVRAKNGGGSSAVFSAEILLGAVKYLPAAQKNAVVFDINS